MHLDSNNIEKYLKKLDKNSSPMWGTLNPSQMLFHCNTFIEVSLGRKKMSFITRISSRLFFRYFFLNYLNYIDFGLLIPFSLKILLLLEGSRGAFGMIVVWTSIRHRASARWSVYFFFCALCSVFTAGLFFENCQLGGPRILPSPCHTSCTPPK